MMRAVCEVVVGAGGEVEGTKRRELFVHRGCQGMWHVRNHDAEGTTGRHLRCTILESRFDWRGMLR